MIWLYTLVALTLSSELQAVEEDISSKEEFTVNEIEKIIERRCIRNGNTDAYQDLWEAIFNFHSCVFQNMQLIQRNESAANTTCTKVRHGSYICLEALLEKVDPCLDVEEKFLLEFVRNVHNTSFEEECKEGVVAMRARKSALKSATCNTPVTDLQNKLVETCLPKVELIKKLHKADYVVKKTDLCGNIETAKECFVDQANLRCTNEAKVVEFVTEYFDHYLHWCGVDASGSTEN